MLYDTGTESVKEFIVRESTLCSFLLGYVIYIIIMCSIRMYVCVCVCVCEPDPTCVKKRKGLGVLYQFCCRGI